LYFYNSLGDEKQLCKKFFKLFLIKSNDHKLDFKILYNKSRQQQDNKLCGLFATDFVINMLNCDGKNREELFQKKFNIPGNFDRYIEKKQQDYIGVNSSKIKTNALFRFINFKNIFSKMFK
jgi:hypothetical protein